MTGTSAQEMDTVMLERNARMLKDAFSRCRRDVSSTQHDPHVRNLAKRIEAGRAKPAEHVLTLAWDAYHRGAPREDVESFGHAYLAIVRSWYAAAERGEDVPLPRLIRDVVAAQCRATVAEATLLSDHCPKAVADAEEALTSEFNEISFALDRLRVERYAHTNAA